jgi:D-arabinose 1-dehydrogenase-like Zn-dependent alcohol dehydrogenase
VKAALMREYHRPLELVERPKPEPSHPNDVLVRIGGAGVCATDLHAIEGLMEPAGVTLPRVLGHENAGWVEELGAGVSTVAKGDAVLVYPPFSCGLCAATTCTAPGTSSRACLSTAASPTTCSCRSAHSCGFPPASSPPRWRRTRTPA